jgi:hypothetical protein
MAYRRHTASPGHASRSIAPRQEDDDILLPQFGGVIRPTIGDAPVLDSLLLIIIALASSRD